MKLDRRVLIIYSVLITFLFGILLFYVVFTKGDKDDLKVLDENVSTEELVDHIENFILLPNEEPSVATIEDIEALKATNSTFYKDARNGDKLVIYSNKAIIFRVSENRIINSVDITSTIPQDLIN